MHDTDIVARMPALDSDAAQPPLDEILSTFEKVMEAVYRDERYLVRDNGAVFRCARPNARRRQLDERWTFGTLNRHSGYFEIAGHVVHRIVATAFHGPELSAEYVVDHIDTNRQNNRPENLRWVTRLDNILLNPITRNRIIMNFGSLEAFFENPGASLIPNFEWMRVVTKEEAQASRKRLLAWAEAGHPGTGGLLGGWVYEAGSGTEAEALKIDLAAVNAAQAEGFAVPTFGSGVEGEAPRRRGAAIVHDPEPEQLDWPSLTANVIQRKWKTPAEFVECPSEVSMDALATYLSRLAEGAVFSRTRDGESTVVAAAISPDGVLSVACKTPSGVKDWSHAKVFVENGVYVHEAGGMFFTQEGAMKHHCLAIGAPTDAYEESIDDYC